MEKLKVIKGAESIYLEGTNGKAVLLLHGFTGNPAEMKYAGALLNRHGFTVHIPRYPGHGTSISEMLKQSVEFWYASAREAYLELSSKYENVYIAGLSMGGIFTILLAKEFNPERIALISTPAGVNTLLIYFAPIGRFFIKILPMKDAIYGINSEELRAAHICYKDGTPVKQGWQLFKYIKRAMRALKDIHSRALIIQSSGDEVIPRDSADYIFAHIASHEKKKFIFRKSNHVILNDYDREEASDMLVSFFS